MSALAALSEPRLRAPSALVWTRDACERLESAGFLNERYELIEGEIILKMGQGLPHRSAVMLVIAWAISVWGKQYVQTQAQIDVRPEDNPTNKPEPDIAVLNVPTNTLAAQPVPAQVRLAVEVADSTKDFDLEVKAKLYARAGIAEYWVVSLPDRTLYVHQNGQNGEYQSVVPHGETAVIAPLAAPQNSVRIADLLP